MRGLPPSSTGASRQTDRRIENGPVDTDRRRRQRRKPTTSAGMTFWDNVGFRVVNVGFRVVSLE